MDQLNRRPRAAGVHDGGFTLIELMITLTVLGTGLLAMLVLQTQALADGARGKHTTGAAMVARDQLERIQLTPFSDADLQPVDWATPPWLDNFGDPDLGAGRCRGAGGAARRRRDREDLHRLVPGDRRPGRKPGPALRRPRGGLGRGQAQQQPTDTDGTAHGGALDPAREQRQ